MAAVPKPVRKASSGGAVNTLKKGRGAGGLDLDKASAANNTGSPDSGVGLAKEGAAQPGTTEKDGREGQWGGS